MDKIASEELKLLLQLRDDVSFSQAVLNKFCQTLAVRYKITPQDNLDVNTGEIRRFTDKSEKLRGVK